MPIIIIMFFKKKSNYLSKRESKRYVKFSKMTRIFSTIDGFQDGHFVSFAGKIGRGWELNCRKDEKMSQASSSLSISIII